MRTLLVSLVWVLALLSGEENPIVRSWLVNPAAQATTNPGLRAILPNVQGVRVEGRFVYVESAGLSLQSMSPFDGNDREPGPGPRRFAFRFPLAAKPAAGEAARTPLRVVGAFLNGVPIYNPISAGSYADQNLWHFDAVASLGRQMKAGSPLVASLMESNGHHSPLIGFALDGYPIYGPYGWDAEGKVRRMGSSYRLRAIVRRTALPDGTELGPAQEGPPVNDEFPLGSFAEDYEYAADSGDLDEHNGRLTRTPEYPAGTYAYFLSNYPYLVGPSYFGSVEAAVVTGTRVHRAPLDPKEVRQIDLATPAELQAGQASLLTLAIRDAKGRPIRFLEKVHERPIHLLVVSTDLAEFAHVHPEIQADDSYSVSYTFPHGGTYWLYADYTRPGATQSISRFRVDVKGEARAVEMLHPDREFTKTEDGLQVRFTMPERLRAGEDLPFRFDLPVNDLEPYLGAWAHVMIVSEDRQEFIHAHPLDEVGKEHSHVAAGPSPASIRTITGFRKPGLYRLWLQFQRQGKVTTIPYTFRVEAAAKPALATTRVPVDAIRVRVSSGGFEPARITIPEGKVAALAFEREDAQNCASAVVFPELGIRKPLPAGETVVVEIPPSAPRELHFACGMSMYRGALVVR